MNSNSLVVKQKQKRKQAIYIHEDWVSKHNCKIGFFAPYNWHQSCLDKSVLWYFELTSAQKNYKFLKLLHFIVGILYKRQRRERQVDKNVKVLKIARYVIYKQRRIFWRSWENVPTFRNLSILFNLWRSTCLIEICFMKICCNVNGVQNVDWYSRS